MRVTHLLVHLFLALLFAAGASAATPNMQMYSPYPFRIDHSGTYTPSGTSYAEVEDERTVWIYNEGDSNLVLTHLAAVDTLQNCFGGIRTQPQPAIIPPGEFTTFVIFSPRRSPAGGATASR